MKKRSVLLILFSLIFLSNFVIAADVAYVYSSIWGINDKIVNSFSGLGLDVENIQCNDVLSTNFSEYKLIFVGNEWLKCAGDIPINEHASVIMNGRNTVDFGLSGRRGILTVSAGVKLRDTTDNFFKAYTKSKYSRRYLTLYSLFDYQSNSFVKIVEPYVSSSIDLGASVAHVNPGTLLTNDKTANENICFFGLHETRFWTDEAEELFNECVGFVLGSELPEEGFCGDGIVEGDEVCDDGEDNGNYGFCKIDCSGIGPHCGDSVCDADEDCLSCPVDCGECAPEEGIHDVMIDEIYSNSINGIRIRDLVTGDYLLNETAQLICGKGYEIKFKTKNIGDFTEDVELNGALGGFEWASSTNLEPEESGYAGSKTLNDELLTIGSGFYTLDVSAIIEQDDATPLNNFKSRQVEIIC